MPYPIFVSGEIIVYHLSYNPGLIVIADIRYNNRRITLRAEGMHLHSFHCQRINNSTLRIARVYCNGAHVLEVDDFDISGEELKWIGPLVHVRLLGKNPQEPLLDVNHVFVPVDSHIFICDLQDINHITGICLRFQSPVAGLRYYMVRQFPTIHTDPGTDSSSTRELSVCACTPMRDP